MPANDNQNSLQAAMARIMGASPGLSEAQTAGGANLYTSGLGPATPGAEGAVQTPGQTPYSNVSANITHEGGVYDPDAQSKEIQKEQLKFSNFAMEETARQRAADLAYQQRMENMQSQAQAEQSRMMQDQLNMQNQLLNQQSSLSQPVKRYDPPAPRYAYNSATVAQNSAPSNANQTQQVRQMNTQQIYPGSQPRLGTQQIYPGSQPRLGTQQIYPGQRR